MLGARVAKVLSVQPSYAFGGYDRESGRRAEAGRGNQPSPLAPVHRNGPFQKGLKKIDQIQPQKKRLRKAAVSSEMPTILFVDWR